MSKILGIDLGTTNSCMAYLREGGEVEIIPNSQGNRTTPSIVSFNENGELLVGEVAKNQAVLNFDRTVRSIKRYIGTDEKINVNNKDYTPQQISAMILQKLKRDAEEHFGEIIEEVVVTVPAYFSDAQRQATKDAGKIAGLKVRRIINEPTAAALAYGLDKEEEQTVLVYDLGGGTFDVSILEISSIDGEKTIEVKSTNGINKLGGDDFDQKLIDYIIEEFKKETKIDLSKDNMALQSIKDAAEKCKIQLSELKSAKISLPFISANEKGPLHLDLEITRAKFESLIEELVEETIDPIKNALTDAEITEKEIDKIILVGGSTRIPMVQEMLKDIFSVEIYKGVNPDEVVARGAAIQGGVLSEDIKGIVLVDVTPLTFGLETEGGLITAIIPRNTVIPTTETKIFTTVSDNQKSVEINVVQGERKFAKDSISLGKFELANIRKAPKGEPRIEVTFDIDVNGILNVSAVDVDNGNEQKIVISNTYSLSDMEIEKMINEAKEFEEEDNKKRELIDLKNEMDSIASKVKRLLRRKKEKISEDVTSKTEKLLEEIEFLAEDNNINLLRGKLEKLREKLKILSEI
ncbi:molecular chaperone DnaK [Haliovirga abyssi]|uniref:Molecular chaperone DnaK n=1 Tax=Haliovirga abyssi TaxID=2996794 RepID=A0AAU9DRW3_9FUSO|nr:molecular chaperone DnaK [Haliovirga abyssi]BDU51343.1 molecular chaperone DnaK [Haliovirga abyssi]